MSTASVSLEEIDELAGRAFAQNGCDVLNTNALVGTVVTAERDGSLSTWVDCRAPKAQAEVSSIFRTRGSACGAGVLDEVEHVTRCIVVNMLGTFLAMAPTFLVGQVCKIVDLDEPVFLKTDRAIAAQYEDGFITCPETLWG